MHKMNIVALVKNTMYDSEIESSGFCAIHLPTWNMLAPYGVLQALSRLSLPVVMNHFPVWANLSESTHESCRCSWYFSGPITWSTSTLLLSILWEGDSTVIIFQHVCVCGVNITRALLQVTHSSLNISCFPCPSIVVRV